MDAPASVMGDWVVLLKAMSSDHHRRYRHRCRQRRLWDERTGQSKGTKYDQAG